MTRHIAEFNFGTLRHPFGDPRIAGFEDNIALVNGIAERAPGFVWRLTDADMEAAQDDGAGPLADRPNTASTLSVWESPAALMHFVDKTLHARFLARYDEWFMPGDRGYAVFWRVTPGHRPDMWEAMAAFETLQALGPSAEIFGAAELRALATA